MNLPRESVESAVFRRCAEIKFVPADYWMTMTVDLLVDEIMDHLNEGSDQ